MPTPVVQAAANPATDVLAWPCRSLFRDAFPAVPRATATASVARISPLEHADHPVVAFRLNEHQVGTLPRKEPFRRGIDGTPPSRLVDAFRFLPISLPFSFENRVERHSTHHAARPLFFAAVRTNRDAFSV